ncbi:unnamed protein product [Ambrosiozyma monospora]|uniref:Unnamed protein product n=1 Tax=Ambrosiozyma monospora TaxID=43982 RepID=A0ACB5T382_AMBMO|nr:unnamed protein product [Ambrosiozyma monospora]
MMNPKARNQIIATVVAGVAGLYICDVHLNNGRNVDRVGLYNWNPAPVELTPSSMFIESNNGGLKGNWFSEKLSNDAQSLQESAKQQFEVAKGKITGAYDEARQQAEDNYELALFRLKKAEQRAEEAKTNSHIWGKDKHQIALKKVEEANNELEKAKSDLSTYGANVLDEATNNYKNFISELSDKGVEIQSSLDDFAEDTKERAQIQYDAAVYALNSWKEKAKSQNAAAGSEIDNKIKEAHRLVDERKNNLRKYGNKAIAEAEKNYYKFINKGKADAEDAYNRAAFELQNAQKEYNSISNSFLKWGKSKNDEAKARVEAANAAFLKSEKALQDYGESAIQEAKNKKMSMRQETQPMKRPKDN